MTGLDDAPSDGPARILIVDDEPLNVDYLEQELDAHGFFTESAANGLEALERVAAAPPDLVLLDVMMPGMDGITALRILKQDPETRLIPVVLMTALNAVEDRVRGIEAGADDFLSKPVDERELLARIRTALSLKRAIDETVGELRSTSAHLERYGRQEREVAILAIEWRPLDPSIPREAIAFVGRSHRAAAEERIRAVGGMASERDDGPFVAVFEGHDAASRTVAAVEAGLAVLGQESVVPVGDAQPVTVTAAVSVGSAQVGSTRSNDAGRVRWVFGADGEPVDRAIGLVASSGEPTLVVTAEAAAVMGDRFELGPSGEGTYEVLAPMPADGEQARTADRSIATILVTDIVGSTGVVERIGDRAWADLVIGHERAVREEIVRFGGREVDTTGDGFIVSFDNPTPAIRCAHAAVDRLAALGLQIRAGIHTGEVEQVEGRARGIALHVASRIAARAEAGEILLSATSRELAAGAGLIFTDRGEHVLRGVSGPRRLYATCEAPVGSTEVSVRSRVSDADPTGYPAGLTAREVDVLRLVARGLSDAEAASSLFVSVRTVNAHLRSIYRKVGVHSRAAAGRFAEENGLL
jgi:DNA-binding NarL/FixJ family response regulator